MLNKLSRRRGAEFFTEDERNFISLAARQKDKNIPITFINTVIPTQASRVKLLRDLRRRQWLRGCCGSTVIVPTLPYLEVRLVDHCNLDCYGCSHLAPFADQWFIELKDFSRDLGVLARIFQNIDVFRVMGGEPLLHPEIVAILLDVRRHFPQASVHCVTNGILLPAMRKDFWDVCHSENVIINLSSYPGIIDIAGIQRLSARHRVKINIDNVKEFHSWRNLKGDTDPWQALKFCRAKYYCPLLKDGSIYRCAISAGWSLLNKVFNVCVEQEKGVDIYDKQINGWKILSELNMPGSSCAYCGTKFKAYAWERSRGGINTWFETGL